MDGLDLAKKKGTIDWAVHKFGSNTDLASSAESIWSAGGLYPWSALDTPVVLYLISTSSSDTSNIYLEGLDENYLIQKETIVMTGLVAAVTTKLWSRIYRMKYDDGTQNVGTITGRTVSGAGTVVAQIDVGIGQTLMAVYTIPADHRAFMVQYVASSGKNDDANVDMYFRGFGGSFNIKSECRVYQSSHVQPFPVPLALDPKMDIDFRASTQTAGSDCVVNFDIILSRI